MVARDGKVVASVSRTLPGHGSAEDLFSCVVEASDTAVSQAGEHIAAIGIGSAGPVHDGAAVSPLNLPQWRYFPLRERVREYFGLPTYLDLDTKALALAEGWLGAARGVDNFLAMVVSTGVGGGLVLDGRLVEGRTGNAGHVGHVIVVPGGRLCGCGAHGCLEAEASGIAIQAITGRPPAEAGPEIIERTGRLVGLGVASVASLCDLDLIVVAGSVALGYGDAFFEAANRSLSENARLEHSAHARIIPGGLGALGPMVGAAAVGWRGLGEELLGGPGK